MEKSQKMQDGLGARTVDQILDYPTIDVMPHLSIDEVRRILVALREARNVLRRLAQSYGPNTVDNARIQAIDLLGKCRDNETADPN